MTTFLGPKSGDDTYDQATIDPTAASVVDADVAASAAIAFSKLAALTTGSILLGVANVATAVDMKTSGQVPVGNGSTLVSVAISGDATLAASGALTVTDLTLGSDAAGDMFYKTSATVTARLAKGTAAQMLLMNTGATAPEWASMSGDATVAAGGAVTIGSDKITPAKLKLSEALTATADGTGTGAMSGNTSHAVVTSSGATQQVSLPASSAALVGKQFTIWVATNGFELITPAASDATINDVDSDGSNQADIGADTLSRVTLVDTGKWVLENLSKLGALNTAIIPDND